MEKNVAVRVENVGMRFQLNHERVDNLKEYMIKFVRRDLKYNEFWALKEVDFKIKKGDRLGVLGLNGSGKSTLLKVVSGVLKPSVGTVETRGVIAPGSIYRGAYQKLFFRNEGKAWFFHCNSSGAGYPDTG